MNNTSRNIVVSDVERGIVRVTINRPDKLNALDLSVLRELCSELEFIDLREDVKVIIVGGAGDRAFIGGADIEEMAGMSPLEFRRYTTYLRRLARLMTGSEKIFIAAVRGMAYGGRNIVAMNCDSVFATPESSFGQQEINFGILGGVSRLIYLVGARRAWDIIMTGRIVTAQEAEAIGLITKCVPAAQFDAFVNNYARDIAGKSSVATGMAKALKKISEKVDLDAAYEYENELISLCFDSEDTKQRLRAFVSRKSKNVT